MPGSADEARANVREMPAIGVDAIKLIYADQAHTGRRPVPMMQPEVMRAIIALPDLGVAEATLCLLLERVEHGHPTGESNRVHRMQRVFAVISDQLT